MNGGAISSNIVDPELNSQIASNGTFLNLQYINLSFEFNQANFGGALKYLFFMPHF
jgi:hypothetical protein